MTALLLIFGLLVPRDTTLIELYLVTTSQRIVVEAITQDSTLLLPSSALHDLLGVAFPVPWVSLDQLRRAYPTITVRWSPEMGQVQIFDELRVLPNTRRFYESHRASAFGTAPIPVYSGLYGSAAVDDERRALLDLGYLYRGRLSLAGRIDDAGVGQWNVSAAPFARLYVNAMGGTRQPTTMSSRVQVGPVWISAAYTEQRPLEVSSLLRIGVVQAFASRQFGVLTITPPTSQVTLQVARQWDSKRTAARISFGPAYASPFGFPVTSIR
jgi:hypothetical protein